MPNKSVAIPSPRSVLVPPILVAHWTVPDELYLITIASSPVPTILPNSDVEIKPFVETEL